jgi:iron complex transport system substrate-binding protein
VITLARPWRYLGLLSLAWLVACQLSVPVVIRPSLPPAHACQVIAHDLGQTQICGMPQRIVALDNQALDLLLALGQKPVGYAEDVRAQVGRPQIGQPVLGVKYLNDYLQNRPVFVGGSWSPSLETVLYLQPDLIIGNFLDDHQYQLLNQIAPTLPFDLHVPDAWQTKVKRLGQILNQTALSEKAIDQYQQKVTALKRQLNSAQPPRLLLLSMSGLDQIEVFNQQSFAGKILADVGFRLVMPPGVDQDYATISQESLIDLTADQVIVMASDRSQAQQIQAFWQASPVLRSLPVWQQQRVKFVDYHLWMRITGPLAAQLVLDQAETLPQLGSQALEPLL